MRLHHASLAILLALTTACGMPQPTATTTTTQVPVAVVALDDPPLPPPIEIATPATSHMTARRLDPPPMDPCGPDAQAVVNGLQYQWQNSAPTTTAYRYVATCLGWDTPTQEKWYQFLIQDVLTGESGHCPYTLGGGTVDDNCNVLRRGTKSDTGFFQLIRKYWYAPDQVLCVNHGYCSQDSIIATPWDSMMAGLLAVMYDGRRPWCYNGDARDLHWSCGSVPRYWP